MARDRQAEARKFWDHLYPDGISKDEMYNELHDFYCLMEGIPELYMQITGGKVSKELTDKDVIISLYEDNMNDIVNENLQDFVSSLDIDTLSGILETADLSEHQRIALRNTIYELEKYRTVEE